MARIDLWQLKSQLDAFEAQNASTSKSVGSANNYVDNSDVSLHVQPILWCSVSGKTSPASTKHEVQSASISQPRRTRSSPRVPAVASTVFEEDNFTRIARACASARQSTELWKHDVLKVFFLKKSKENVKKSTLLTKWKLDEETIMDWANRWSSQKDCVIPVFELCMRESEADIIVELNGKLSRLVLA